MDKVTVDKVSVIDSGGGNGHGSGLGRFVTQFPAAVLSLSEQIETATGVSLLSAFKDAEARKHVPARSEPSGTAATSEARRGKPAAAEREHSPAAARQ